MRTPLLTILTVMFSLGACAQKQEKAIPEIDVGGSCEGCEAIFESPVPFNKLNWIDTLPGFDEPGQKLEVSGSVFKPDGKNLLQALYCMCTTPISRVYTRSKAMKMAGVKDMVISVGGYKPIKTDNTSFIR